MGRIRLKIEKEKLKNFYIEQRLPYRKIAKCFSCSRDTIRNRLLEYKVRIRNRGESLTKYPKVDFSGNKVEGAYLMGFRIGDLNVYKPCAGSSVIVARCHTTHPNQVRLMKELFGQYGRVTVSHSATGSFHINCYLNQTFNFLFLKDSIPQWVKKNRHTFSAFIAGYTDAEGNFILNQKRGRFKIDSYDFKILDGIKDFLIMSGVGVRFRRIAQKGGERGRGKKWNNDLWRLNVNEARSLKKFIRFIWPYLRHEKRRADAGVVLENVNSRISNETTR